MAKRFIEKAAHAGRRVGFLLAPAKDHIGVARGSVSAVAARCSSLFLGI